MLAKPGRLPTWECVKASTCCCAALPACHRLGTTLNMLAKPGRLGASKGAWAGARLLRPAA